MHPEENRPSTSVDDRRSTERQPLEGTVTVRLPEQQVIGPGQNVSEEGVFFVAEGSMPVEVRVEGETGWRRGEVVRVQSMGPGKIGMAIKFF